MSPHFNGQPIGPEALVPASAMPATAERMFADGADEVRVRPLRGKENATRARISQEPKRDKRAKRKAQKRARREQRR